MFFSEQLSNRGTSSNVEVNTMHTPPMLLDFTLEAVTFLLSHAVV